ncbi:alpha-tectorin-like [Acanthopagrus latus]|uniref:alpha-tectorin-like n=1 Tax=Acanthopagrus latus TaxID=8177 RepID=UPI00187C0F3F|nr:alpha-tectorin-like [Acanthopagrus latus]
MNITSCPITYYGQEYDKIYVSYISSHDICNVYKTNTTVRDPNICSTVTCNVSGVATAVSDCGPMEHCQGNGSCILNTMCTVTGSTVIDFIGRVRSVPDRCGYTLMRSVSIPGLQVLGVFQERRRKDVSFLDHVILQLDSAGVQISLEQGGRVQLNGKELMLNNSAQVDHDVELSRDQTGLTAKISASNHTLSVHFDGNTAQIHMRGPGGALVHGLCGNSSRSREEKISKHSATGCGIQYSDAADSTINCNATTEWCNILKQTPFTVCNKHINPEPFVTACTRTLCKYPAVDGLKCQFLEAYARVCSHLGNVTVENWRSKIGCSRIPKALCQDRFCSAHEFCGERSNGGKPRCHCRAIFASKYRSTSTFGEPTVCSQKSASVNLANCLLEDKGIDFSVLHLNDPACKGELDNLTHMVTFNSNSHNCGAVLTANKSQIIYKNTIMTRNSSLFGLINRHDPVHIDFSCYYSQPDIKSLAIKLKDSSVNRQITSGEWNYNLTMKLYTNFDSKVAIQSSTEINLDQKIWVELKTGGLDDSIVRVVTDSCWATNQPSPSGSLRYDLIIKGCPNPADETVKVEGNGLGTSNYFSFNMFQFSGTTGGVYLHCRLVLCVRQGDTCAPRCNQAERRRRSVMSKYEDEKPTFITMAWTY